MSQSGRLAKNHLHIWLHASWQNTQTAGWLTGLTINQTNQQQEKLQKFLVNSPVMGETIYKIVKFLLVIIFKMPKNEVNPPKAALNGYFTFKKHLS